MQAAYYYVTQRSEQMDFHLLHRRGCHKMSVKDNLAFIGTCYAPLQALTVAKIRFGHRVKACYFCCQESQDRTNSFTPPHP